MALLIFPSDKLTPTLKLLLDPSLRQEVASAVNETILSSQGAATEARIRYMVRLRAWAEEKARDKNLDLPPQIDLGLGDAEGDGEPMVT